MVKTLKLYKLFDRFYVQLYLKYSNPDFLVNLVGLSLHVSFFLIL